MKKIFFVVLLVQSFFLFSQNITDKNGLKQGVWVKKFPNSSVIEYKGNFIDNKPVGKFTYFFISGKVKSELYFKEKEDVSYAAFYHEEGGLMAYGKFKGKNKDSIWMYYSPLGRLSSKENYLDGKLDGEKIVYYLPQTTTDKSVRVSQKFNYKNDVLEGEQMEYFENGKVREKYFMVNGNKHGEALVYNTKGVVTLKDNFYHGAKNGWCFAYDDIGNEIGKVYYKFGNKLTGEELDKYLEKINQLKKE